MLRDQPLAACSRQKISKRPTLTSFHPTPPSSSSLLQLSINSEEVQYCWGAQARRGKRFLEGNGSIYLIAFRREFVATDSHRHAFSLPAQIARLLNLGKT
jgi:hypothetical protein